MSNFFLNNKKDKDKDKKRGFCMGILFIFVVLPSFAQPVPKIIGKYSDIGDALNAFAGNNSGRMNITADMGLNWSDSYIGELISFPPHYGFGFTSALDGVKSDTLNTLMTEALGTEKLDPWFAEKQFFPTYLVETRIGGFRGIPFDIGLKAGFFFFFPLFGDYNYNNLQFGGDIRYNIINERYSGFKFSIGLGINYLEGYFQKSGYEGVWTDEGGTGGTTDPLAAAGSSIRIDWNNLAFNLKLSVNKTFRTTGISIFGGLAFGYGISKTGLAIIGEDFTYKGDKVFEMNAVKMQEVQDSLKEKIGGGTEWSIKNAGGSFGLWGTLAGGALDIHTYEGISFAFGYDLHLQAALVFDLLNLEYGLSIGFRWQPGSAGF